MKRLDRESIEKFHRDGFLAPVRVISEAQATACRQKLEDYEQSTGAPVSGTYRFKLNLLFNG